MVVIAAAALFIVLAGFGGLEKFALNFTSVFDPDLKVFPETGKTFQVTPKELEALENTPGIAAFSKVVEERVFLNFKQKNHIAYIKGVDGNYGNVNPIDSILGYGNWSLTNNTVVIGNGISNILSLGLFDRNNSLQIIAPKPGKGSITSQQKPYNDVFVSAVGIYNVTEEIDKKYVFAPLQVAQQLTSLPPDAISYIEIRLTPDADVAEVQNALKTVFKEAIYIKNREQLNDALYRMLNTENIAIYLIFTLVIIVALFNLAGAITMMILDKRENLKTLFAMGVTLKQLRRIFFLQGILITVLGGCTGLLIGGLLVFIQQVAPFVYIPPALPYPVVLKFTDFVIVLATITILGVFASKIASNRISEALLK